jgi:hypothetical protein
MVSTYPSTIIMDRNTMMNLDVVIGHVTIYMRAVMGFGHVLMDEMKIIVVEQYVLHKLIHVYLLLIIHGFVCLLDRLMIELSIVLEP